MIGNALQELAEEGGCRHHHGAVDAEAISGFALQAHHDLKRVGGLRLRLEMAECRREAPIWISWARLE